MSEVSNPLFNNERDFLERQKEEYKKALMGDVDTIKAQGQEIGKKVAMAGGVLLAGYLVKRLISGGKKKAKKAKVKQPRDIDPAGIPVMTERETTDLEQEEGYGFTANPMFDTEADAANASGKKTKQKGKSDVTKVLASQAATLLMMYIAKKVSEQLNTVSENNDIAGAPATATDTVSTENIATEENAI